MSALQAAELLKGLPPFPLVLCLSCICGGKCRVHQTYTQMPQELSLPAFVDVYSSLSLHFDCSGCMHHALHPDHNTSGN